MPQHADSRKGSWNARGWVVRALLFIATVATIGCATRGPVPVPFRGPDEETLKLQIFLDSKNFGPGVVDGRNGEFTRKALALYRSANGLPPDTPVDTSGISAYTTHTVEAKDLSALGTMAEAPAEIARQSKLPYTKLGELLAERFHTTAGFLRYINPGINIDALAAGESLQVPNVRRPFRFDRFPSQYAAGSGSAGRNVRVVVDVTERMLQVMDDNGTLAAFPITPGSSQHPAPQGEWRIVGAVPWPWYRYDEGVLKQGVRTDDFYNYPPGPNSPVGILWAGLNKPGVGIHGTSNPDTIGRAGSHGCIRLSNWDAAIFHTLVRKGTTVSIR